MTFKSHWIDVNALACEIVLAPADNFGALADGQLCDIGCNSFGSSRQLWGIGCNSYASSRQLWGIGCNSYASSRQLWGIGTQHMTGKPILVTV